QYGLFIKHDHLNEEDYRALSKYCRECKIDFLSTPFDFHSADYLEDMMEFYKISSSDLTNLPFIRHIARKGKPIYLSTGASYLSEVEEAVRAIEEEGCKELCLLHCVLSYPTKNEDANLNMISYLKTVFPRFTIGYSDHTLPDETMTILTTAYLLGATVLEKHFTLNKNLPGNDHYHGMDPSDLRKAVANFKLLEEIGGQHEKTVLPCELTPRREARRSIVLTRDLEAGHVIQEGDLMLKRPGTGIAPVYLEQVIGKEVKESLVEDTILTWDMIQ
ncbi:MAG: N-acetylneuraminate synthase family protein, partial [Eubacteriales bacterium]